MSCTTLQWHTDLCYVLPIRPINRYWLAQNSAGSFPSPPRPRSESCFVVSRISRVTLGKSPHGQQCIVTLHTNVDSYLYMIPPNQAPHASSDSSSRQGRSAIFPLPPRAVLPIPRASNTENSSGTSSLDSKRKRPVVDDGSDAGRSRARASSTPDFNNTTKAQVREQYNNKCWH